MQSDKSGSLHFCFALIVLGLTGCGGSGGSEPPADTGPATFHFKMHGDSTGTEDFRAVTSNAEVIANARDQLAKPPNERNLHITGAIAHGDGGFNLDWNWHFIPDSWGLAEVSIELCDTSPTLVSQCVECWVDAPGGACPWGSYVAEEIDD